MRVREFRVLRGQFLVLALQGFFLVRCQAMILFELFQCFRIFVPSFEKDFAAFKDFEVFLVADVESRSKPH